MTNKTPFFMSTILIMMMSTIMAISSSNWIMLWIGLELNLLAFIPIILYTNQFQETEAAVKYFLTQALGSSLLIMSSMSSFLMNNMNSIMLMSLLLSLMIKLGLAPCHLWYPSAMMSMSWNSALILSTWQKLAPLSILSYLMMKSMPTIMMILASVNALMGGLMGLNQSHLRSIMAYSSITHLGWMVALMSANHNNESIMYFILYAILIIPIFWILNKLNASTLNQMNNKTKFMLTTIILPLMLLSLAGMPPLLGFMPKLMSIYLLSVHPTMTIILIMGSLMNLYYYLNILFSIMLKTKKSYVPIPTLLNTPSLMILITLFMFPLIPLMFI